MYKTVGEFLTTLPEQQLVEVYDKNHNLSFKGKAGFAPVWLDREPYYSSRSEEFTGIDGKKGTRYLINEIYTANAAKSGGTTTSALTKSEEDAVKAMFKEYGLDIEKTSDDTNSDDGVLYKEYVVTLRNPDRKNYDKLIKALDKLEEKYDIGYWDDMAVIPGIGLGAVVHFFHFPAESTNSSLNASSRDYILPEYRDLYDEVGFRISEVLKDSIKALFDKELSPESVKKEFSEYDAAWADVAGNTSDLDSAVYAAAEAISDKLVDLYFKAAPEATNSNRHLNSAGVIRIGNKAIPTDTRDLGYADYETVQREGKRMVREAEEAAAEKEAEARRAARAAELDAIGKEQFKKFKSIAESSDPIEDKISAAFEIMVPASDPAQTQAGETIRALSRILYRYYNDGDYFYTDYGLETAGPSAAWLASNFQVAADWFDGIVTDKDTDEAYEGSLESVAESLFNYLVNHPEFFGQEPTADSTSFKSSLLEEWESMSRSAEVEVDVSGLEECVRKNWIDWDEVYEWLRDCVHDQYPHAYINQWAADGFTIEELTDEEAEDLESDLYSWIEQWIDELTSEYGDDEDYDDDDDYDEDY